MRAVGADGDRLLAARLRAKVALSKPGAVGTSTIPLRETTASRGPENPNQHVRLPMTLPPTSRRAARRGRVEPLDAVEILLVRADFGIHFDFDEARCFPVHGLSPWKGPEVPVLSNPKTARAVGTASLLGPTPSCADYKALSGTASKKLQSPIEKVWRGQSRGTRAPGPSRAELATRGM
jgi:hypothetical protein